jgi:hypothetical protein
MLPALKGMNRFLWNFRTETITPDVNGVFVYGDYRGYRVSPGRYVARLSFNGQSSETAFEVLQDPRLLVNTAQWQEQQQFLKKVTAHITSIHKRINSVRSIRQQVQTYNDLFKDREEYREICEQGKQLADQISRWEGELVESRTKNGQDVINWPSKLNVDFFQLKSLADAHDPVITEGLKARLRDLEEKWTALEKYYQDVLVLSLKRYNDSFRARQIPAVLQEVN